MLDRASQLSDKEGLHNISYMQADAQVLAVRLKVVRNAGHDHRAGTEDAF
jgi:hypothetical protein